jgi:glycosyltransferase involved in cell wall biosynthesis
MSDTPADVPLVTVGVPTYKRPELLRRALACVAAQDYANIELIVADNDTPGDAVTQVVAEFRARIPALRYIKHPRNIGAYANFFSILEIARGKYFMWLADDDEISSNYVSRLTALLEDNPDAPTAAGHWVLMDQGKAWPRATASFPERSALLRSLRFIWRTDDSFFYALHRTAVLRQASFPGYWWPNRGVLLNWGYVFLLDLVLRGPVLLAPDRSVQFLNHETITAKLYLDNRGGLAEAFRFCVRRINVHWLYLRKTSCVVGLWTLPLLVVVCAAAATREIGAYALEVLRTKLKRLTRAGQSQVKRANED